MPNATAVCLPRLAAACPCSSSTANLLPHLAPSPHPPAAFFLLSLLHRHSTKLRWISQEKTPTRSKTRLKINNEAEPHHGTVQSELRRWERYKPNNLRKSNLAVNVASGESRQLVISSTIPENDCNLGWDWDQVSWNPGIWTCNLSVTVSELSDILFCLFILNLILLIRSVSHSM